MPDLLAVDSGLAAAIEGIRLPDTVSGWPPGPGWWLVAALALAFLVVGAYAIRRRHRYRRAALAILQRIRADYADHGDNARLAMELNVLLRRAALVRLPRNETASLTGHRWLALLDRMAGVRGFSEGTGRALASAPYERAPELDGEALLRLVDTWLRKAL